MERLHARYPFLSAAREAVGEAGVDLAELVAEGGPPVERALDRVESAIETGRVGDPNRSPRVELLSYPVARVLVSLVDRPELTRVYARSEAATAHERFRADFEDDGLKSTSGGRISLDRLLAEFDLSGAVRVGDDGTARVAVGPYLRLAGELDGEEWRLAARDLHDGVVPVEREELHALIREAVRARVAEGLPLSVPDAVADALADERGAIETALADYDHPRGIDLVVPGLFPPCMRALLDRARSGEDLPPHSAFSLLAFLTGIGMDGEEVAALCDLDHEAVEYRVSRLRGEAGGDYPPPSCATMQAYGDCVNRDDLCSEIATPANYYARRIEGVEDPTDWRETLDAD